MAHIIKLPTIADNRGSLTVIEKVLPFSIKRVYYIYDVVSQRGGHGHKKTIQALVAINGGCDVFIDNGKEKKEFTLDSKDKCLIVYPEDWHTMDNFSKDAILLVLSSEFYDKDDYIHERY